MTVSELHPIRLLVSREHDCGYLPDRTARSAFVDPALRLNPLRYGTLLEQGFRRSGSYVYRPLCRGCNACRPARIVVADFTLDRSLRRCRKINADLTMTGVDRLSDEHYALYRAYLQQRHPDGGMDPDDAGAFHEFLHAPWSQTAFWEFRCGTRLLALAVVDQVPGALSAVYTFYDPAEAARGLGSYAILRQIGVAADCDIDYVYLGYWVGESRKMDYKRRFKPLELLAADGWRIRVPTDLSTG